MLRRRMYYSPSGSVVADQYLCQGGDDEACSRAAAALAATIKYDTDASAKGSASVAADRALCYDRNDLAACSRYEKATGINITDPATKRSVGAVQSTTGTWTTWTPDANAAANEAARTDAWSAALAVDRAAHSQDASIRREVTQGRTTTTTLGFSGAEHAAATDATAPTATAQTKPPAGISTLGIGLLIGTGVLLMGGVTAAIVLSPKRAAK